MLTVEDIARVLQCSARTVRREIQMGRFPRPDVKIGSLIRWKPATVQTFLDGGAAA